MAGFGECDSGRAGSNYRRPNRPDGNAREAVGFYASLFPDSHVGTALNSPADDPSTKRGEQLIVEFTVLGQSFVGLNGGPNFTPSEAVSFQVFTDDQAETDRYWNAILDNGGKANDCSWCKDRWGFSWQIVPRALMAGMADFNPAAAKRVMEAMMTMKKIDITQIEARAPGMRPMRRIMGGVFQSLDGVMQAPGGPTEDPTGGFAHGGWMFPVADEQVGAAIGDFFSGPYDLLLGRRTYDIFAGYWPYATGDGAAMGKAFTAANKYVLTRGAQPLPWENSYRMHGIDDVAVLKHGDGPDLLIQGSSEIYPGLLAAGLLDRLVLYTFPIVLGHGKRLFGKGTPPGRLNLIDHKVSPGGTVIATYESAGPVETGSFGPIDSAREDERQRKMKDGTW